MDGNSAFSGEHAPERTLLLAVIHRAIDDVFVRPTFRKLAHTAKRKAAQKQVWDQWWVEREKALQWLLHETDERAERLMSLDWISPRLGYPASTIRKRIRVTLNEIVDESVTPYRLS